MSINTSFEAQKASYANRWNRMQITGTGVVNRAVDKLLKNKSRYQSIEAETDVPWYFIAICHMRESDANFNTYLGNGQSLSRKTTIVPKGRGPFASFEEGAIDALKLEGLTEEEDWSLEHILYLTEKYNGFGYMRMGKASPYVWGQTNIAGLGKYVSDGKYDPNAKETQPGTAALLKGMMDKDKSIKIGSVTKTAADVVNQPLSKSGVVITSAAGGAAAIGTGVDQAKIAIDTANQFKEGTQKLGVWDGFWHAIYQYPYTFGLLAIAVGCASAAIYFRWKAKKSVPGPV